LTGFYVVYALPWGAVRSSENETYYAWALVRGIAGAQVVSMLALGALLVAKVFSVRRDVLRLDLESVAGRMLWIFLPYAALVLFNLVLRMFPSTDIRSATSVFMLGPLTAIRPFVMIAGIVYGISKSSLLETRLLGLFILALMLSLELLLNRLAARAQVLQIRKLV
jgi:hypothetical protein